MAVEKIEMMNLVGPIKDIDKMTRQIVALGNVHIVNASHGIGQSNFTVDIAEENIDELVDLCSIRPYKQETDHKQIAIKINKLMEYFKMEPTLNEGHWEENYDFKDTYEVINPIYEEMTKLYQSIKDKEEEVLRLEEFDSHTKYLKNIDIDLDKMNDFRFFHYKMGILSKENRIKLKMNYENISAIVFHIGSNNVGEVYLVISPRELELETDRILRSLNFKELEVPKEFSGKPSEVMGKIEKKREIIQEELTGLYEALALGKEVYESTVEQAYNRLKMEETILKIKNQTACTNSFFYLSGWVIKRDKEKIKNEFEKYGKTVLIMFKESSEVNKYIIPPTKLRNNKLLKPFENLVKMYGIPSYDELDPTVLLSMTYMVLFGAMFGDVGQGLVLFLAGLFLSKKPDNGPIGGILVRLGLSSTLFGFLYGSVFGFETIIEAILIRPIENINHMLLASIVLGMILLIVSFLFSMVNAMKQKNLKEGLFGRNGLTGFLFYLLLLNVVLNALIDQPIIPNKICYIFMVLLMGLIVVREPLANVITNKRPLYRESASNYYIESGFEIVETLLSMLSSTVSFIRVGAFALNHVGLFIAFETMAKMVNSPAASIFVYILGNIIVIGLEGLIVFIQGLRLEYYEMFSKYYKGEGVEFHPAKREID